MTSATGSDLTSDSFAAGGAIPFHRWGARKGTKTEVFLPSDKAEEGWRRERP
jgi:hypothetical protein